MLSAVLRHVVRVAIFLSFFFKFMVGLRSVLTILKAKGFLKIQTLIVRVLVKQYT